MGFFFNHQSIFRFRDFFYTKLCSRMILKYVIKYITKLFDIPFFMQYVCKKFNKLVFPLNTVYRYTLYLIFILMCCCWDSMLKNELS